MGWEELVSTAKDGLTDLSGLTLTSELLLVHMNPVLVTRMPSLQPC